MSGRVRGLLFAGIAICCASPVSAEPALFEASFLLHAWGTGSSSSGFWQYVLLPPDCHDWYGSGSSSSSSSSNGPGLETHGSCHLSSQPGKPATGSGLLSLLAVSGGPSGVALPQSAFGITTYDEWPSAHVTAYATLRNAAASFFAGSGPAASGTVTKTGMAPREGSWIIRPAGHAFGGPMAVLGHLGAYESFMVSGKPGTYRGTMSWNMIAALGRERLPVTPMGPAPDPMNPHTNTGMFVNTVAGVTNTYTAYGTGTPWTTGDVTVYAEEGSWMTVMRRSGFDTTSVTSLGNRVRNIQLVTPALTHWRESNGTTDPTGHIGILNLRIVPEPGAALLLALGAIALAGLRSARHRG
jgi:hypothetical protein